MQQVTEYRLGGVYVQRTESGEVQIVRYWIQAFQVAKNNQELVKRLQEIPPQQAGVYGSPDFEIGLVADF